MYAYKLKYNREWHDKNVKQQKSWVIDWERLKKENEILSHHGKRTETQTWKTVIARVFLLIHIHTETNETHTYTIHYHQAVYSCVRKSTTRHFKLSIPAPWLTWLHLLCKSINYGSCCPCCGESGWMSLGVFNLHVGRCSSLGGDWPGTHFTAEATAVKLPAVSVIRTFLSA